MKRIHLLMCSIILLFIACEKQNEPTTTTTTPFKVEMTFDDGEIGENVTEFSGNFSWSTYSDDVSYDGSPVLKTGVKEGSTGWGQFGAVYNFPSYLKKGDEFWLRFRQYMPSDWVVSEGNRMKWMRLRTKSDSIDGDHEGYNDVYLAPHHSSSPFTYIGEFEQHWFHLGKLSDSIVRNTWETYEIYYKFDNERSSEGGTALLRFWKNGKLVSEMQERKTLNLSSSVVSSLYFLTYFTDEGALKNQYLYFDDVKFTNIKPENEDELGNPYIGM